MAKNKIENNLLLDYYQKHHLLFKRGVLQPIRDLSIDKTNYRSLLLMPKDYIYTRIEISSAVSSEDIQELLEIKTYEELGLDYDVEYHIVSFEVEPLETRRVFDIFVIEKTHFEELLAPLVESIGFIDAILPAPYLFKELYGRDLLISRGVDAFLVFNHDDVFVNFYKNGSFLYAKSLGGSLLEIYESHKSHSGSEMDYEAFLQQLGDGEFLEDPNIVKIFDTYFEKLKGLDVHLRRAFELEKIDRLYVVSGAHDLSLLAKDTIWEAKELSFTLDVELQEANPTFLQRLELFASWSLCEEESSYPNLTLYPRPPALLKRPGGKLIVYGLVATILGLSSPITYAILSYTSSMRESMLEAKESKLAQEVTQKNRTLVLLKSRQKSLESKNNKTQALIDAKVATIETIYQKKVMYHSKADELYDLTLEISKSGVVAKKIVTFNDGYGVDILADNPQMITQLMGAIATKYRNQSVAIKLSNVTKTNSSNEYKSYFEMRLK